MKPSPPLLGFAYKRSLLTFRVPTQNLSEMSCIVLIWWSSGIKMQPRWLTSDNMKVLAIAILPGRVSLNLLQKFATLSILAIVELKLSCSCRSSLSICMPSKVIDFFTTRPQLSSESMDLTEPTGMTQVLPKLQCSPEKAENIFYKLNVVLGVQS